MYTVGDVYVNRFFLCAHATRYRMNITGHVIRHFLAFCMIYKILLHWSQKYALNEKLWHGEVLKVENGRVTWRPAVVIF